MNEQTQSQLTRQRPPFTILENYILEDPEVTKSDLLVYWVLCYHADKDDQRCFPSIKTICTETRSTKPTVLAALNHLVELGYILKEQRYSKKAPGGRISNLYTILYKEEKVTVKKDTGVKVSFFTRGGKKQYQELNSLELDKRGEATASTPSEPPPPKTDLPSGGNGQGRRCTDPVILAFIAVHIDLFGFEPQLKFPAVGARLKQLRTQFTDDQLIQLVQAAAGDDKAWYRLDKHNGQPTYDLLTLLSSDAINQIRRNHPAIWKSPEQKPHEPCPVCGGTTVIAGMCGNCRFDLRERGDPQAVEGWREMATRRGLYKPQTAEAVA